MALLSRFDTPASLRDIPADSTFYARWSQRIENAIRRYTPGDGGGAFYDPTEFDVSVLAEKAMVWMGFPRDIRGRRDRRQEAYAEADAYRQREQKEYVEWRVDKNRTGKITRVTFVTEFLSYYEELWKVDPEAVVKIYRHLVSPRVKRADLESDNGAYEASNRWNTSDGIVHLIQGINRLSAAIKLCQDSAYTDGGSGNNYEVNPAAASLKSSVDPRIAYDVNMLVRKGLYVTLRDPIGFYIIDWDNSGIKKPDGRPAPLGWWRVRRGRHGMVLRLEYEVPAGTGFVVGDLSLGGRRIEYGAQLAEQITVGIYGTAGRVKRG